MPTYEYECRICGHIVDVFHNMTVKRRVKCPECGGGTKKLIGAGAGIIFKGSGFYETDYKRKSGSDDGTNHRTDVPAEKPAEPKKEEKKEAKSEKSSD